jgi:hypothetical protein
MEFDVFISYANQDKVTADAACAQLEAEGIRCWIAPRDVPPGAEWAGAIVDAIDQCRAMVLIFSSSANGSKQIRREVQRAFDREVPVVPFRIENIVPEKSLAYYMGPVHWLDALTTPLEHHLQRLVASVRALVRVRSPDPAANVPILREAEVPQRAQDERRRTNEADERRRKATKSSAGEERYERRRQAEVGAIRQGGKKSWWPPLAVAAGLGLLMLGIVGAVIYQRLPQTAPVAAPLAAISTAAPSMAGTWRGQGHQIPTLGGAGEWSIVMTIENAGGSIEYPSLGCGGTLTQISNTGTLAQFREHITHMSGTTCIDGGLITVNSVNEELAWSWTVSYKGQQINAVAALSR